MLVIIDNFNKYLGFKDSVTVLDTDDFTIEKKRWVRIDMCITYGGMHIENLKKSGTSYYAQPIKMIKEGVNIFNDELIVILDNSNLFIWYKDRLYKIKEKIGKFQGSCVFKIDGFWKLEFGGDSGCYADIYMGNDMKGYCSEIYNLDRTEISKRLILSDKFTTEGLEKCRIF